MFLPYMSCGVAPERIKTTSGKLQILSEMLSAFCSIDAAKT
jgi:hypothetical protein